MLPEGKRITAGLYNTLHGYPLFNYVSYDTNKKASINVFIVGSGDVAIEAFKTIFWIGQVDKCKLNICLASDSAKYYESTIKSIMPGLASFNNYANITYLDFDFTTLSNNINAIKNSDFTYFVVATDTPKNNEKIAKVIKKALSKSSSKIFIGIFTDNQINKEEVYLQAT